MGKNWTGFDDFYKDVTQENKNKEQKKSPSLRKWQAVFDRGQDIYFLVSYLELKAAHLRTLINQRHYKYLRDYFSILEVFYLEIKRIIYKEKKELFDIAITQIEEDLDEYEQLKQNGFEDEQPIELVKKLKSLHDELIEISQIIGMGIPVDEKTSGFDMFRQDMLGGL